MMRIASTSRRGQDVRMVAGTESMVAMDSEACFEPLVSARRRAEGMGSKGAVALSYERQASMGLSVDASEAARVRSSGLADGPAAREAEEGAPIEVVAAAAVAVAAAAAVVVVDDEDDDDAAGRASWALGGMARSLSTWPGAAGWGCVGFPLTWPLRVVLLFCLEMRLPGAARPFSCRLSCAAFLFDFATIDGGAGAGAGGQTSPRRDSTAGQDEPDWKTESRCSVGRL